MAAGAFEPKNDLERQLLAVHEGRAEVEGFMHLLLFASQVFMPVKDDDKVKIKGFQRSNLAVPLSLEAEDGTQVLILFTSPERAKGFVQDHPGYGGGLLTELKWVLERMGSGYGIALNPGWDVGIDLDPDMVQQLAAMANNDNRQH